MDEDVKDVGLEDHDRIGTNSRPLSLQPFLLQTLADIAADNGTC